MSRTWTVEQLDAINKEGQNIIVSAGAGSGKTAVLTERIIRKLREGININDLLILTFTKAAALEMKNRIRESLKKEEKLKHQLDLLDSAYITTFDSYALSVVRKYNYLLNVNKQIDICDSSLLNIKKREIIDTIFDEMYENSNDDFNKLISDFCNKDDKIIKKSILEINDKLNMKYDKDTYLNNYLESYFNSDKLDTDINSFVDLLINKIDNIKGLLSNISTYLDSDQYLIYENSLNNLLNSKTYLDIKNNLDIKLPNAPRNADSRLKGDKALITNTIKELKELCYYSDIDEIKSSILSTKPYVKAIINVIKKLDQKMFEYKNDNDLYEFIDIALMAIKLVDKYPEVRHEVASSLNEILLDEYQDTSDLQEKFISLISNNNTYMVGDIKQSIYRFRNANPNIFKDKYNEFKNNHTGLKIDLNKNFRSRSEIIDDINLIFDSIIDEDLGGINYKNEHRLIFGNNNYKSNDNNHLEIYNYEYKKGNLLKKEEIEAFIIGNDIKDKISNHYQIMDKDTNKLRDITYQDITILMDRGACFDTYKKIITYLGIPLNLYQDELMNSSNDILVIKNILKLIYKLSINEIDKEFKYAFLSVGRSFIFEMSDQELFDSISNNKYFQTDIIKKASLISSKIAVCNISEVLYMVMDQFDIYHQLIKIGNIKEITIKLDYLKTSAVTLSKLGFTIEMFIKYLEDSAISDDIKIPPTKSDVNACQLMTIHKSKGLEFSLCYYPGLYKNYNIVDIKDPFLYDSNYGIITPYFNEGINQTIYKHLFKSAFYKDEVEEKIRLFYVALTRSKEKMILISDIDEEDVSSLDLETRLKYRSYKDVIASIRGDLNSYFKKISIENINQNYKTFEKTNYKSLIGKSDIVISTEELNIKSNLIEDLSYSKKPINLLSKEENDAIEIGKKVHYYLEKIDFKNPNYLNIESFYIEKIKSFINSDIIKELDKCKIYKEYEFIYMEEQIEHHGIIDLILEYDNSIVIVDYKFKDIDKEEYIKQVTGYKNYISTLTNKPISVYLYSIIDEKYKKVD